VIYVKDHKQYNMFNPFEHLGPKRLALLESSWAHLFREEILHKLPVEKLFPIYSKQFGRPTKELYAMLGIVLLQQQLDLTDDESIQQFSFNIMWHYALNVTDTSDLSSYVSPRTLWGMRDIVARLELDQALFENITDALKKLFELDPSKQRLDSIHIFSNMAHLGRIRLFVRTIRKFLVNLKRHHADLYQGLGDVAIRYEEKNDGRFAVKPSESSRKLQEVGDDCFLLVERFKGNDVVADMASYKLLVRMFTEQCVLEKTETATAVVIKQNKDVPSDSLQNPSDPDAGYCGHKGKGYQMQVMETYSEDKSQPNLITHVKVEAAHESDSNALLPAIEGATKRELAPTQILADSAYGGDDNVEQAKELGVEVVSPTMGAQSHKIGLAEFIFTDNDEITACPEGKQPLRTKSGKHGGKIVHFDKALCDLCPRQSDCPVKRVKQSATISYDTKALRLARRRAQEKTAAFNEAYRFRAGAEGTMSDLDRITGIKRLRVRGMRQVRLAAVLKATGLNILRATAFKNRLKREENRKMRANHSPNGLIGVIKEHILLLRDYLQELSGACRSGNYRIARFESQAA
jgi:IS5 family transposase